MRSRLVVLVAGALLVAGCSESVTGRPQAGAETTEAQEQPTKSGKPKTSATASKINATGAPVLPKRVGEDAGVVSEDGERLVTFRVDKVEVDPECPAPEAKEPEKGHFVVFTMTVEPMEKYTDELKHLHAGSFEIVSDDGVDTLVATAAANACFPESEQLTRHHKPGAKTTGKIVFDTKYKSGNAALKSATVDGSGWVWEF